MRWRHFVTLARVTALSLTIATTACASPLPAMSRPALFIEHPVVLPIGDPFIAETLYVTGKIVGADRTAFDETFIVDSGAAISVIREGLTGRLRVVPRESTRVMTIDPLGQTRNLRSFTVRELWFDRLLVRDLNVATVGNDSILGNDILGQRPWEIDLDRATLTIDAPAWPAGSALTRAPLGVNRFDSSSRSDAVVEHGPLLTVRLNGHGVTMTLDTGASQSALPASLAKALSLKPDHPAAEPKYLSTTQTLRAATSSVTADLTIGDVRVGDRTFLVLNGGAGDRGVLGLDVLRRYAFRVDPGRWLELRARQNLDATAAARLARWPWAPQCLPPGCAEAHIEGTGDTAEIVMTLSGSYRAQPTSFIWRCRGDGAPAQGQAPVIGVFVPTATVGQTVRLVPKIATAGWLATLPRGCTALTLVDVGPAGLAVTRMGAVAAVLPFFP